MGCAASSSSAAERQESPAKKYANNNNHNVAASTKVGGDNEHPLGGASSAGGRRRTRRGDSSASGAAEDYVELFKEENMKPLMCLDERMKVVQLYASTFQSARQVLATIGRIKTTMKRWVQAARQRLQEKKAAQQNFMVVVSGTDVSNEHNPLFDANGNHINNRVPASPKDGTGSSSHQGGGGGRLLTTTSGVGGGADHLVDADGWTVGTPATMRLGGYNEDDEDDTDAADLPLFPVFLQDSDGDGLLSPATTRGAEDITPAVTPLFDPTRRQSRHDDGQQSCSETNTNTGDVVPPHHSKVPSGRGEPRKAQLALAGETLIAQRLKHLGLEQVLMDNSDGNCQFRSLAHQILGDASRHAEVRKKICAAMIAKQEDEYSFLF
ncbi:Hypothetical protein, putative, partial [Bodo saltans]